MLVLVGLVGLLWVLSHTHIQAHTYDASTHTHAPTSAHTHTTVSTHTATHVDGVRTRLRQSRASGRWTRSDVG
jgi:hypothetical protein